MIEVGYRFSRMVLLCIITIGDFLGRRGGKEGVMLVLLEDWHDEILWLVVETIQLVNDSEVEA